MTQQETIVVIALVAFGGAAGMVSLGDSMESAIAHGARGSVAATGNAHSVGVSVQAGAFDAAKSAVRVADVAVHDSTPRRILIGGPSRSGKSLFVDKLTAELGADLVRIEPSMVSSTFFDGPEKHLASILRRLQNVDRPTVALFEDLDQFIPRTADSYNVPTLRAELIDWIDRAGANPNVTVAATTRDLSKIDPAVAKSFEVDMRLELPDAAVREETLRALTTTAKVPVGRKVNFVTLADRMKGFSEHDLSLVVSRAESLADEQREAAISDKTLTLAADQVAGELGIAEYPGQP